MLVAVWKSTWLPASETFVRNQIDSLKAWNAVALGIRKQETSLARTDDRILFGRGLRDIVAAKVLARTGYSRRLSASLKLIRPNLIHAHFANEGMVVMGSARRAGIPLIVTLHGKDATAAPRAPGLRGIYYRYRLRRLFDNAALIVAVSSRLAMLAEELGAENRKLVVHHIGIPMPQDRHGVTAIPELLAVGRMIEKKGFEHLIRAVAMLPDDLQGIPVTIVGDGPLDADLKNLAASSGVAVAFTGFLPPEKVKELMRRGPIVCVPSVVASDGDEEGLPTVAMEAAAEGCAVIAYRHSGLVDAVDHDITGLIVDEGDVVSLAGAIAALIRDPSRAERMGRAGREKMIAEFDIERQTGLLEELYDRVLRG
jgi:glycosyltransferase involved in cell wall biosynthesis